MKHCGVWVSFSSFCFLFANKVMAQSVDPAITDYTKNTLNIIVPIATAAAVFFLIKGGYEYIVSAGNPRRLESAKHTIQNALLGLVLVLGSTVLVTVFRGALVAPNNTGSLPALSLTPITAVQPNQLLRKFPSLQYMD